MAARQLLGMEPKVAAARLSQADPFVLAMVAAHLQAYARAGAELQRLGVRLASTAAGLLLGRGAVLLQGGQGRVILRLLQERQAGLQARDGLVVGTNLAGWDAPADRSDIPLIDVADTEAAYDDNARRLLRLN